MAYLLKELVLVMAMHYRRAPLPVSRTLLRSWMRHGLSGGLDDLESLIRRYLRFGDERLARMELRGRPAM